LTYRCPSCDDGSQVTPAVSQAFKFDVVATLPESWTLSRSEIRAWWSSRSAEVGE
jgi:hypothetical protein